MNGKSDDELPPAHRWPDHRRLFRRGHLHRALQGAGGQIDGGLRRGRSQYSVVGGAGVDPRGGDQRGNFPRYAGRRIRAAQFHLRPAWPSAPSSAASLCRTSSSSRTTIIASSRFISTCSCALESCTRNGASAIFLVTRALASGTRLYVAAIILLLGFEMISGTQAEPGGRGLDLHRRAYGNHRADGNLHCFGWN